jgi:hypothetical protein
MTYKHKIIVSPVIGLIATILLLTCGTAYASEVTGSLSSGMVLSSGGSTVSGTLGGSTESGSTVSGTVSGGSSGGGSGSGSITGSVTGGSTGGGGGGIVSEPLSAGSSNGIVAVATPSGSVLGASTDIPNYSSLTDGSESGDQGQVALANESSPINQDGNPLVAAVGSAGIGILGWLWILLLLLLVATGIYAYRRYYLERNEIKNY